MWQYAYSVLYKTVFAQVSFSINFTFIFLKL